MQEKTLRIKRSTIDHGPEQDQIMMQEYDQAVEDEKMLQERQEQMQDIMNLVGGLKDMTTEIALNVNEQG